MAAFPSIAVWPILLGIAAICAFWNWRAMIVFAAAILAIRLFLEITQLEVKEGFSQLVVFAIYSCIGVMSLFFWDKLAGAVVIVLAFFTLIHIIDLLDWRAKVIIAEVVMVLGMLASAYLGPHTGILARSSDLSDDRYSSWPHSSPDHLQGDTQGVQPTEKGRSS